MRKTTGPAARKVSEWQDLTCWVVGLNQRADFYEVVGSSIGNTGQRIREQAAWFYLRHMNINEDTSPLYSISCAPDTERT